MYRIVLAAAALALGLAGCNGGSGGDDCPAGTDGCPCRDAGVCEVGLTCIDAVCVANSGQGDGDDGGDPYDPDPNFRIRGSLVDAGGSPVGAGVDVYIYKAASVLDVARDLLSFPTIADAGTYTTTTLQTEADSTFYLSMTPSEVNTGTDFFCVVHFEGGVENAQLASATNWHTFTADKRDWNIEELGLWDAPTAVQTGGKAGVVTFDWTASPAPSGRVSSTDIPAYLFATDTQTFEMRWREYAFAESIVVPRGVFPAGLSVAPTFSVIGASMPSGGGDPFLHRTTVKSVEAGWTAEGGVNLLIGPGASINQGTVGPDENRIWWQNGPASVAMDDDLGTPFEFHQDVADIFIDRGSGDVGVRILLYNLKVSGLRSAVVRLEANTGAVTQTSGWVDLGQVYRGLKEGKTWVYLATPPSPALPPPASGYRSFHITLEPQTAGGPQPYFLSVAEIKAAY